MALVSDIVFPALQAVGMKAYGLSPGPDETDTAIQELNRMFASMSVTWANFFIYDQTAPANGNAGSLTMGTSGPTVGDFPQRAARVDTVYVLQGGLSWEVPVRTYEEYRAVVMSDVPGKPQTAYHKRGFPFEGLYFYPALASNYAVRVVGLAYMPSFATVSDEVPLPPEYIEAAWLLLAKRLAILFGAALDDQIVIAAKSAMRNININNALANRREQGDDIGGGGGNTGWNYQAGWSW